MEKVKVNFMTMFGVLANFLLLLTFPRWKQMNNKIVQLTGILNWSFENCGFPPPWDTMVGGGWGNAEVGG